MKLVARSLSMFIERFITFHLSTHLFSRSGGKASSNINVFTIYTHDFLSPRLTKIEVSVFFQFFLTSKSTE